MDQCRSLKGREGEADERGEVLQLWREGPQVTGVPQQNNNDTDQSGGTHQSGVRSEPDSWQVGKLECPTEPVVPTDDIKVDRTITCSYNLENTLVVSAITLYQLIRHLMAPITLVDSIKTTAMVDSGAMGNFIHLRFIEEHQLVTIECNPLTVNDVNGHLLLCVD